MGCEVGQKVGGSLGSQLVCPKGNAWSQRDSYPMEGCPKPGHSHSCHLPRAAPCYARLDCGIPVLHSLSGRNQ